MDRVAIRPEEAVVRRTLEADIPAVLKLYDIARRTMRENGNPLQWPADGDYPGIRELQADMRREASYVLVYDEHIAGTFALVPGEEPSYAEIADGSWLNGLPYRTIHRLAGDTAYSGIAACCFEWCKRQCGSLRSDTHRDNLIMRLAFEKAGFMRCGVIRLENGGERTAYQWTDNGKG